MVQLGNLFLWSSLRSRAIALQDGSSTILCGSGAHQTVGGFKMHRASILVRYNAETAGSKYCAKLPEKGGRRRGALGEESRKYTEWKRKSYMGYS